MTGLNILRVDGSARKNGSVTRQLSDAYIDNLQKIGAIGSLKTRDTSLGMELINEDWITANFTDSADRSDEQNAILENSDILVEEVEAADLIVIGLPVYNFGVPAAVKAWVDMVVRARKTFRYTENGPVGLLTGKKAVLVVASGGTGVGSDIDFATNYMKHILGFIGIDDVEIIAASGLMMDADMAMAAAHDKIAELTQLEAA